MYWPLNLSKIQMSWFKPIFKYWRFFISVTWLPEVKFGTTTMGHTHSSAHVYQLLCLLHLTRGSPGTPWRVFSKSGRQRQWFLNQEHYDSEWTRHPIVPSVRVNHCFELWYNNPEPKNAKLKFQISQLKVFIYGTSFIIS